ncbi:MAG: hypothetical protein ACR2F2_07590 [Pyrinomonadaceae bacterium]
MFDVNRFGLNFCKKILPAFVIAFILGIAFNDYLGRYTISYSVTETFTKSEAESLLNKKISTRCFENSKTKNGSIISYEKYGLYGTTDLIVEYDEPIMGKYKTLNIDKNFFEKCVDVLEK